MKIFNLKKDFIKIATQTAIFFISILIITRYSNAANPAGGDLTVALCNVVNALQGTLGKAIATIAVIVLGVGLFLGKLSWPLAIATAIGIGLIFGASSIVEWIGGAGVGGGNTTCATVGGQIGTPPAA